MGIFVLVVLIALVVGGSYFIPPIEVEPVLTDAAFEQEYAQFVSSLSEQKRPERTWTRYTHNSRRQQEIVLAHFDPNTADSVDFVRLGLPPWMAKNILHYRAKGGRFRQPEEFRKVYGLTEEQFATLAPYIHIDNEFSRKDTIRLFAERPPVDTLQFYKHPAGTIISLNRADTTELKKIPGIGSGIARMIVSYRKQLGGFYRIEQLNDIRLSADKLRNWFTIGPDETQRINLNKAGIERINSHPYINFYQAKVIVEHRKKKGELKSLQQLKLYEEFTSQDFERIEPYICF